MALGSIRRQKESEVGLSSSVEEPQCYADMAASHNNVASSANNNSTRCSNLTKTFTAALKYVHQLFSIANLEQQIDMNQFLFTFVNEAKLQLF